MMIVDADREKNVISRKKIESVGNFSLELVKFEFEDDSEFGYGCRIYSPNQSEITMLYDNKEEPLKLGMDALKNTRQGSLSKSIIQKKL